MEPPDTGNDRLEGIVCAALGGDPDERAAHLAGALARRLDVPLTLADIREPLADASGMAAGSYAAPVPGVAWAPPPGDLDRLAEAAGLDGRRMRIEAPRAEALRRIASDPATEMLVVRDHGGGPVTAAVTADAGRAVTREAAAPVALVPDVDARLPVGNTAIVCAVDAGPVADTVAAFAGDLAARLGAVLHLVHAGQRSAQDRAQADELVERCRSVIPHVVQVQVHHAADPPAPAIRGLVTAIGAQLVVVGRPDHGLLLSAILGSVVHSMLNRPVAPLIVVPDALHAGRRI